VAKKKASRKAARKANKETKQKVSADDTDSQPDDSTEDLTSLEEGMLLDYITGKPKKENARELVRQRIARALFHEYGISVDDMQPDFPIKVGGRRKKVDIAIFESGEPHEEKNVRRVVVCRQEPKNGKKGTAKMRDHDQAKKDLEELKAFMTEVEGCKYGLWTNGLEMFFLRKEVTRFDVSFEPLGDWPLADESLGTREVVSDARMRRADPEMLRNAFRRCHNFIHGNEGMPKDAAFWQFLYLIFCKMYDERHNGEQRRFWAGPSEQFEPEGRKRIHQRIMPLFDDVKQQYSEIFRGNEEITLTDRALAFMVSELAKYDFGRTDVDAKGSAYQEIVGTNLRGDRGQYFTPRGCIKLMVSMMDPKPNERMLDPACGTGGFLIAAVAHQLQRFRDEVGAARKDPGESGHESVLERVVDYTSSSLFGADFDQFLVRASSMNLMMAANTAGNVSHMDSLAFPNGHLPGNNPAKKTIPLGSIDVLLTNPPFGAEIPITDPAVLRDYDLAQRWDRGGDSVIRPTGSYHSSVAPEVLFIQRSIEWLRPGGRMGIVLPNGILGNPGDEYIRRWILRHCWVLASVEIPVEAFIVEANVNILTSLLFLKRKTTDEISAEDLGGPKQYPVFMAVAEKVGFDRRGKTLHKRHPDGEEIVKEIEEKETIRVGGRLVTRTLRRKQKMVDDDLPAIAEAYRDFRAKNKEPGA